MPLGHDVTVFESSPEPGGMLRYAIPEYRLPKAELAAEIAYIERLGVRIRCGCEVGRAQDMETIRREHDALFIAAGAPAGVSLGRGWRETFRRDRRSYVPPRGRKRRSPCRGQKAAVIGGGNTAVDCARHCRRLGCASVMLLYRRTRAEMPAADEEVEALWRKG